MIAKQTEEKKLHVFFYVLLKAQPVGFSCQEDLQYSFASARIPSYPPWKMDLWKLRSLTSHELRHHETRSKFLNTVERWRRTHAEYFSQTHQRRQCHLTATSRDFDPFFLVFLRLTLRQADASWPYESQPPFSLLSVLVSREDLVVVDEGRFVLWCPNERWISVLWYDPLLTLFVVDVETPMRILVFVFDSCLSNRLYGMIHFGGFKMFWSISYADLMTCSFYGARFPTPPWPRRRTWFAWKRSSWSSQPWRMGPWRRSCPACSRTSIASDGWVNLWQDAKICF